MWLPWKPQLMAAVIYHLPIRENEFYVLASPVILCQSVKLQPTAQ